MVASFCPLEGDAASGSVVSCGLALKFVRHRPIEHFFKFREHPDGGHSIQNTVIERQLHLDVAGFRHESEREIRGRRCQNMKDAASGVAESRHPEGAERLSRCQPERFIPSRHMNRRIGSGYREYRNSLANGGICSTGRFFQLVTWSESCLSDWLSGALSRPKKTAGSPR